MSDVSRVMLAGVSLAAALTLAGCGDPSGTPQGSPDSSPSRSTGPAPSAPAPSGRATPQPSETVPGSPTGAGSGPTRSPGSGTPSDADKIGELTPLPRARAGAHLLEADRLPRFAGRTWRVSTDDHAGGDTGAVGACHKTELGTIGALDAVSRHYTAERGARAVQVVARFPDAKTAWRAHRVLVAWRDDCEQRVRDATVGPLRPVTVRSGRADSYLASYRSRAAGLGILRSGTLLTLVEVSAGREAYPSTWDPTRVAVRRIARTF